MKVVIFVYYDMGCQGVQVVLDVGYEIVVIFIYVDNFVENIFFGFVFWLVVGLGILVYVLDNVNYFIWVDCIVEFVLDIIFLFYYCNLLSEEILYFVLVGVFNLYGFLLFVYCGCVLLNWVLVNGESEMGVMLYCMVKCVDVGEIVVS